MSHVNELNADRDNLAYLLAFDSTYGRFPARLSVTPHGIAVSDNAHRWMIRTTAHPDIGTVDWECASVDVIVEATGRDSNADGTRAVARSKSLRAIVTRHWEAADAVFVAGVSQRPPLECAVIAASTCDANAIAPVLRAIQREWGISMGMITTLHPWLPYQNLLDGPVPLQSQTGHYYGDYALGRASPGALIPKTTTTGSAVCSLVPELSGHLHAVSFRTPVAAGCYADLSLCLERGASRDTLIKALGGLAPVTRLSAEPLVSVDLIREPASAVIDLRWLHVERERYVKVVLGYDNEWGYASRIADLLDLLDGDGALSVHVG